MNTEFVIQRAQIEQAEDWTGIMDKIPFIQFPADWKVAIIPPFAGAVARFRVLLPGGETKSIYLDWHNRLGYCSGPYWEVYPVDGDTGRCLVNETEELLRLIATPGTSIV